MTEKGIRLIVGLGNPGERYRNTPHNIGFEVLDTLAGRHQFRFRRAFGLQAWGATWQVGGSTVRVLKPRTFMNHSGVAVRKAMRRWKISPEEMLLVFDDVAFPVGRLRIRKRGGAGGHNGVTSVIQELDNLEDFPRLRLGVGPRPSGDKLIDYLLGAWHPEKETEVSRLREQGADALERILREGLTPSMNHFNSGTPDN
ncbi:aminoacyl-tRNA hydrolase [Kiritimatiellaeota bacterium B1221]|nr:aminoacyl-tRNA hydrolase [Kiritimatiellaeota bacterium B1221]